MEIDKIKSLNIKIKEAMRLSGIKLVQDKIRTNGKLIIYKDGEIKTIEGEDLKKLLK